MMSPKHPRTWTELSESIDIDDLARFRAFVVSQGIEHPEHAPAIELERLYDAWLAEPMAAPPVEGV